MSRKSASRRSGEHGQILVFVAVSLVALLGMGALSIDAAYMFRPAQQAVHGRRRGCEERGVCL